MAYNSTSKELWVGVEGGFVHMLKADLSVIGKFEAHVAGKHVNEIVCSPDGTKFATGDNNRKISIWDANSKDKLKQHSD